MPKILVVEDEPDMLRGLRDNLAFEGYEVVETSDGNEVQRLVGSEQPDLILLDVMLPGMDGFEVCRQLREAGYTTPILMLTARSQEIDVVRGLELGADDYITKPFGVRELLARIKAALRRGGGVEGMTEHLRIGEAEVDLLRGQVRRAGRTYPLGHYESEILRLLTERAGQPVTRATLLDKIWGTDAFPTDRTVDNHIVSLRRKIESDPRQPVHILTVHGVGYKFIP
ncbi:MAG: response regulator transcription factor [Phycisphaerae bacterium]|nr:response regulator transcription factor [Phycisphaerae bacterium]